MEDKIMWTLSGFIDEISPDPLEQAKVAAGLGLRYAEVRSAWKTNILDLTDEQLATLQQILTEHGLDVSSIGSPLGKIKIDDDFDAHLARTRHAVDVARRLKAPYVRIFSFFVPPEDDPAHHREEVLHRLREMTRIAEEGGVIFLHENEKDIYGDTPERCLDIVESIDSPNLRLAWDSANFVQCGVEPFTRAYPLLRPHVEYVQIKDARSSDHEVTRAGEGDGQVPETLRALRADGFDGFFSLEPHLIHARTLGGFSGPDLFTSAFDAFTGLLEQEGIRYA
jgi:sugar phosphate isomerase/epimerase